MDEAIASRLPDRLRAKIRVNPETACWEWQAAKNHSGYGVCRPVKPGHEGWAALAHRVVYELLVRTIPEGLVLDHLCSVPHCVNPAHLEPVTRSENNKRAGLGKRQSHCHRGHPLEGANLGILSDGERYCRACARENARNYYWTVERVRSSSIERARRSRESRRGKPGPGQAPMF